MSDAIIETQTSGVMRTTKAAYREMMKLSLARPAMAFIYLHVSSFPLSFFHRVKKSSKESLHPATFFTLVRVTTTVHIHTYVQ